MSTWTNTINTNSHFRIFYADAQEQQMSGDFCKEYRLYTPTTKNDVILDVNDTVGAVGNCRVEAMIRNSNTPTTYNHQGNNVLIGTRIHQDSSEWKGIFLLYDYSRTFSICYGNLNLIYENYTNNLVMQKNIATTGTVTIRWDVITTTDNAYILTKLEMYSGTTWSKLMITGFNIPTANYSSGKIGIGGVNLADNSHVDSSYFDAVKIYLPA
jgi:hypothetical protein